MKGCGCLSQRFRPPFKRETLTQARLQQALHYEPETGVFVWKVANALTTKIGDRAGSINGGGYRQIDVEGKKYKAHRLAWLYVYGYLPKRLDHKNRDRTDNRIMNLREATRSQNAANSKTQQNNSTGLKGVRRHGNKWQAVATYNGKRGYFGTYDTPELAHKVYCYAAKLLHGEFFCNGRETL
jgi:hypothetical protein